MRHVTPEDLERTRQVLAELAERADLLTEQLNASGIVDHADRADWLIGRRTPDQQLVWDRRWARLLGNRRPRRAAAPKPVEPMKPAEVVEELDWLLGNGMTPWEVSESLGRSRATLSRLAYRHNRPDLGTQMLPANAERTAA